MGVVTASIVVNFGDEDQGILKGELDGREDGYNGGDTSFSPGDTAAFLIYKTSNVSMFDNVTSLGSTTQISSPQNRVHEEFITFADSKKQAAAYPVFSNVSYEWIGNNLGTVTVLEQKEFVAATKGVGVLKVTYTTQFIPWRLTNIPTSYNGLTAFPVLIFLSGEVI